MAAGRLPVARGLALSDDDRRRAAVIEAIMYAGDAVLPAGVTGEPERAGLAALADDGLLRLDGERLRLSEAGRPLARVVAATFDAYLPTATARHSAAL